MPGLLDNINNPWMALGAGLLQAGGPHLDPSKASLGAGLTSGLNAISAQQQMQFRQALLQQQQEQAAAKRKADWAKVQEKQAEAKRKEEGRGMLMEGYRTKNPEMILKGGLISGLNPSSMKGLLEQAGGNQAGFQFGSKGLTSDFSKALSMADRLNRQNQPIPPSLQTALAVMHRATTEGKTAIDPQTGRPYPIPGQALSDYEREIYERVMGGAPVGQPVPQGAPAAQGGNTFATTGDTPRVLRENFPPGTTPEQVAGMPALEDVVTDPIAAATAPIRQVSAQTLYEPESGWKPEAENYVNEVLGAVPAGEHVPVSTAKRLFGEGAVVQVRATGSGVPFFHITKEGTDPVKIAAHKLNERKFQEELNQSRRAVFNKMEKFVSEANNIIPAIDTAIDQSNFWTTGPIIGEGGKKLGVSANVDLKNTLTTVQAIIGFQTLQGLRDASETGGAVGQVSNFEQKLMQATAGSVEQEQGEGQLDDNLRNMRNNVLGTLKQKYQGFVEDYGQDAADRVFGDVIERLERDQSRVKARRGEEMITNEVSKNPNSRIKIKSVDGVPLDIWRKQVVQQGARE